MLHLGLKLYKVYINDDPGFTLTHLWQGQMWLPMRLNGENLQQMIKLDKKVYVLAKRLTKGLSSDLPSGNVHV